MIGTAVYDVSEYAVEAELIRIFSDKKLTFCTAESCTGGMICQRLCAVPGASAVLYGGIVSYDNSVKMNVLRVPASVLEAFGAVSEQCAAAMADGARKLCRTDVAVSVTGIAGPDGGTAEKPVGTVCFAVAWSGGVETFTEHFGRDKSRETRRRSAAKYARELASKKAAEA